MEPDQTEGATVEAEPDGGVVVAGPFGGMTPAEASAKGVEARRKKAEERERDEKLRREAAQLKIVNAPPREQLRGAAAAVLFDVAEKILAGDIEIRTAREASSVAETFFNILRLESGQSTSNVEHLTSDDRVARLQEIREAVAARQQAAVEATASTT